MKLKHFIDNSDHPSQSYWAKVFNVSRPYLTQIINGTRFPSKEIIISIDHATKGEVPPASWFDGQDYASLKKEAA